MPLDSSQLREVLFRALEDSEMASHFLDVADFDVRVVALPVWTKRQRRVRLALERDAPVVTGLLPAVPWRAGVEHCPNLFQRDCAEGPHRLRGDLRAWLHHVLA